MKIISKFKDYYDYLSGIYGEDERLILDRRVSCGSINYMLHGLETILIGGKAVQIYVKDNVIYTSDELKQLSDSNLFQTWDGRHKYKDAVYLIPEKSLNKNHKIITPVFYPELSEIRKEDDKLIELSKKHQICIVKSFCSNNHLINPKLEELKINKVVAPMDIWITLTQWLSDRLSEKEPIQPIGDDKIKIISAGFDLKTSFRNVK